MLPTPGQPGQRRLAGPGGPVAVSAARIELSNHVLMVASFGPHVYGLIVWVCTLASEGSEDSGLTP